MSATISFDIGERKYRTTSRLSAFVQNHIARKMTQVWAILAMRDKEQAASDTPAAPMSDDDYTQVLVSMSGGIADNEVDYVIGACLSIVQVQQVGGAWAPIRTAGGDLMFPLDMHELMLIVWKVVKAHGIVDFFGARRSSSAAVAVQGQQ